MEEFLTWFQEHPGVLGFLVSSLVFFITIFLVSKKWIGFSITLLLLLFALVSGITIANQQLLLKRINSGETVSTGDYLHE
ncbi:MAG: hypothetical protein WD595_04130 [Waddliaceae bacterium]